MFTKWIVAAALSWGCGSDAAEPTEIPLQGTCEFRLEGDSTDVVRERAEIDVDSGFRAICFRGNSVVAVVSSTYYTGPGQVVETTESVLPGRFFYESADEYIYSSTYSVRGEAAPACRFEVLDGPPPQPGPGASAEPLGGPFRLSVTCTRLYGISTAGFGPDGGQRLRPTRSVALTDGVVARF